MYIVIAGTVGIGKSTTSRALKKTLSELKGKASTELAPEPVASSVYLEKYYEDPVKWTLVAQLDFLLLRHKQLIECHQKIKEQKDLKYIILDRHLTEDYVFANMHSTKKNMRAFNSLAYHAIYNNVLEKENNSKVDYFFLLKAPFEDVITRVKKRGIEMEQEVETAYWKDLYKMYYETPWITDHFQEYSKKFIEIDASLPTKSIVNQILDVLKKDKKI